MRLLTLPTLISTITCAGICAAVLAAQTSSTPPPPISSENRALSLLNEGLKDRNPDTRKQAVQSLGLVGPREPFLTQVETALQDKDLQVRLAAIASMVDLKSPRTVPALQNLVADETPEVGFAAAKALWLLNDPVGKEALVAVLSGDTKIASGFITKQKRDTLRMLHTPATLLLFAVQTGADLAPVPGLGAGVSSLQGILTDPDVSGRAATAILLGPDKDPAIVAALRDALADKDGTVRAAAAHAIALRDDPKLQPALLPLLEDKKEAVRLRASAGYLRLEWIKNLPPPPPPAKPAAKKSTKKAVSKSAPATKATPSTNATPATPNAK